MATAEQVVTFSRPIRPVFQFVSDPMAWMLAGREVGFLSQRPIAVGAAWSYADDKYTCSEFTPHSGFSVSTAQVVIRHQFAASRDADGTVCTITVSGTSTGAVNRCLRRHHELLVDLKKILEGTQNIQYTERVGIEFETGRSAGFPSIVVRTHVVIKASPERVFSVIIGDPSRFWQWMVDRKEPGGLSIAAEWPKQGSTYRYRKSNAARILAPFRPWDTGIVRIVAVEPGSRAVLEEHQDVSRATVRTTYEIMPEGLAPEPAARLDSEYFITSQHWLWGRILGRKILSFQPGELLRQTANIVGTCEVPDR